MRMVLALVILAGCTGGVIATAPGVRVWESAQDSSMSEGETTLDIAPDAAYAAATDYARWPEMFPDIARVEITEQHGIDARVTFIHQDGNRDNVHFHNRPQLRTVWFEDTGGSAEVWAEITFTPGARPGTTRVRSRLFADVHGLASIFVTDAKLRSLRQQRIASDLSHLHTYFARLHIASHS